MWHTCSFIDSYSHTPLVEFTLSNSEVKESNLDSLVKIGRSCDSVELFEFKNNLYVLGCSTDGRFRVWDANSCSNIFTHVYNESQCISVFQCKDYIVTINTRGIIVRYDKNKLLKPEFTTDVDVCNCGTTALFQSGCVDGDTFYALGKSSVYKYDCTTNTSTILFNTVNNIKICTCENLIVLFSISCVSVFNSHGECLINFKDDSISIINCDNNQIFIGQGAYLNTFEIYENNLIPKASCTTTTLCNIKVISKIFCNRFSDFRPFGSY